MVQLGQPVVVAHIGQRQINARTPQIGRTKKQPVSARPTTVIKAKGTPTETPFIAEVWAAFAEAAHSAKGGTMEDVNNAVRNSRLTGLDTGAEMYHKEERERASQLVPQKIARWRQIASRKGMRMGFGSVYQPEF